MPRNTLIQYRNGTATNWNTTNPILASGEPGFELDTNRIKIGTGANWNDTRYITSESLITTVFNNTGSIIPKFTVVYINGGQGDQPTIQKAIANSEATSSKTYGITAQDIGVNSLGPVIVDGALTGLNTDQFNPTAPTGNVNGTALWLSPSVSGGVTTSKPYAPNHMVFVGTIIRTHQNEGIVEVKIQNGYELEELHNVATTGATNGQFLQYNSSSGLWFPSSSGNFSILTVNTTGVSLSGHSHSSSDITNFNSSVNGLINGIYAPLSGTLNQFANTTSAQLRDIISDETGSGILVFNTSPSFTGIPTVPTATSGTNTNQIASTSFVRTEISNSVISASNRKVIYVSKGDSATDSRSDISKYDQSRPFATLVAAKNASASGDLIVVEPGLYVVKSVNLAKNGVNWFFHIGTEINCDESDVGESLPIFSDSTGPMVFKISGHLKLSCTTAYDYVAIFFQDSDSFVDIELDEIDYRPASTNNPIVVYNGSLILKARKVYNNSYDSFEVNGSYAFIEIDEVEVLGSIVEFGGSGRYYAEIGTARQIGDTRPQDSLTVDSTINSQVKIGVINGNPVFIGTEGIVEVGLIKAVYDDIPASTIWTSGLYRLHKVIATTNQPAIELKTSGASLQEGMLIAGSGANYSIVGTHSIKIFGNVVANKPISSSVTQLIGTTNESAIGVNSSYINNFNSSVSGLLTPYQLLLTNPVTGTGTASYIPKWTSASGISNSLIYDNGTNIGIGTTSPNGKLHVIGSGIFSNNITASGFIKSGGTSSQFLKANGSVDSTSYQELINDLNFLYVGDMGGSYISSDDILFNVLVSIDSAISDINNDSTILRTNTNQSISGIKTFTNNTVFQTGALVSIGINPSTYLFDVYQETGGNLLRIADDNSYIQMAPEDGAGVVRVHAYDDLYLTTNNGTIRLSGTPTINGQSLFQYTLGSTTNGQLLIGNGSSFAKSTLTAGTGISITNGSGTITINTSGLQTSLTNPVTGTGIASYLTKWSSTSGLSNSLVYDNGTNIGIGTTSPQQLLHISGSSTSAIGLRLDNGDGYGGSINADNGQLYFIGSNSVTVCRMTSSKIRLGDGSSTAAIELTSNGTISQDGNGGGLSFSGTIAKLSNGLQVTGGSVGVGTTSPSGQLHVIGSGIITSGLYLNDQTASTIASFDANKKVSSLSTSTYPSLTELSYIKGITSAIQTQINTKQNTLTNPVTGTGVANHIAYWNSSSGIVADSGQLYWDSTNHRLGIGTDSPSNNLSVVGSESVFSVLGDDLTSGGQPPTTNLKGYTWFGKSDGSVGIGAHHADYDTFGSLSDFYLFEGFNENVTAYNPICLAAGYDPQLFLDTSLNVGIGTATPTEKLDVNGSIIAHGNITCNNLYPSDPGGTTMRVGSSVAYVDLIDNVDIYGDGYVKLKYSIGNGGAVQIVDVDSNIAALTVSNNNIGIGTTTPSGKLDINGNVNIDGNLTFDSFTESVIANGNSSTSKTLSLASGTVHTCTLTDNCTFTMPTATAGKSFSLFLNTGSGNFTASFSGVRWSDSTAPTITSTASKVDLFSFISDGSYWYGSFSQNYG